MKVAFVVEWFPKLSETFILNQITGLLDRGHELDILAGNVGDTSKMHPEVNRYELLERTTYLHTTHGSKRLKLAPGHAATALRLAPGALAQTLNLPRFGSHASSGRLLMNIAALAPSRTYDVIHAHFGPSGVQACNLRTLGILKGKLVTTFHAKDIARSDDRLRRKYGRLFRSGDFFLPISQLWKNKLLSLGVDPGRVDVHRMGVDTRQFPMSVSRKSPDSKVRILTIGRLIEKKGVAYGLRAVSRVAEQFPDLSYTIVGDGGERSELERLASELKLESIVTFAGWQEQDGIQRLMQDADILLAPSVTSANGDMEGIPVVLMEAMASGIPVISTMHSGIPELVSHGESGLLVPERDPAALADALAQLVGEPNRGRRLAAAAREKVEREYDIEILNDRLEALFLRLAGVQTP